MWVLGKPDPKKIRIDLGSPVHLTHNIKHITQHTTNSSQGSAGAYERFLDSLGAISQGPGAFLDSDWTVLGAGPKNHWFSKNSWFATTQRVPVFITVVPSWRGWQCVRSSSEGFGWDVAVSFRGACWGGWCPRWVLPPPSFCQPRRLLCSR